MDLTKLSQGEKLAAGSAVLLFIFMFFKWFGVSGDVETAIGSISVEGSVNAWDAFDWIDLVLLLTIVVTVAGIAYKASTTQIDFPLSTAITLLGALSTLLVLYRLIDPPSELGRKLGVWLGLITAAGIAIGGYLAMQEEGTSFQDAADRLSSGGGRGGGPSGGPPSSPPPPPPPSGS